MLHERLYATDNILQRTSRRALLCSASRAALADPKVLHLLPGRLQHGYVWRERVVYCAPLCANTVCHGPPASRRVFPSAVGRDTCVVRREILANKDSRHVQSTAASTQAVLYTSTAPKHASFLS